MSTLYEKLANPHPEHKTIYDAVRKSLIKGPRITFGEGKKKFGARKMKEAMQAYAVHAEREVEREKQVDSMGMYHPLTTKLVGPVKVKKVKVTIEVPLAEVLDTDLLSNHGVIG